MALGTTARAPDAKQHRMAFEQADRE